MRKWQRMAARLGAGVLAALLAGCAAGGQRAGNAPGSADTAAQAETAEAGADDTGAAQGGALHMLGQSDGRAFYQGQAAGEELGRLWVTDLAAGQTAPACTLEGCAHDTGDCPATYPWPGTSEVLALDGGWLLYPGPEKLYISDTDGANFRELTAVDSVDFQSYCSDGTYLYLLHTAFRPESAPTELWRIDPASGEKQVLDTFPRGTMALGAAGRTLVLCNFGAEPLPGQTAAGGDGSRFWDVAYNLDSGEARRLGEYADNTPQTMEAYEADPPHNTGVARAVVDGVYYVFDFATRIVTGRDAASGETVLTSDPLPGDVFEGRGYESVQPVRVLDGWLELAYDAVDWTDQSRALFSYLVSLETGEVRRKPDLPELVYNGGGRQPMVFAQIGDKLLVDCRAEPYDRTDYGPDGAPYTVHSERRYLGLITAEDYLNGTPNYKEVGELIL